MDENVVAETLAWCNGVRAEKGMPPLERLPKGVRDDPASCPCGKATGVYVERVVWRHEESSIQNFSLPDAVSEFVDAFDLGELPEYDVNADDDLEEDDFGS